MIGSEIVVLHCFIKKTQETPEREMATARKRLKGIQNDK
jgi:phage-related protein